MELARLIDALAQPTAYPYPIDRVEVCHTHISVVFLAGSFAYKIKKPVNLGFLDFSTPAKRQYFCAEEVRLNRRLAPEVYLGVAPVNQTGNRIAVDAAGDIVDWAVKMRRLPDEATLLHRVERAEVGNSALTTLAQRIAGFHARADASAHIATFGRFEVVANNVRENFRQAASQAGVGASPVSSAVFEQVQSLTETALTRLRPLIESRALRGVPRDTHGDLRLDHVYLFPDRPPPADLVVIDCIEFNERFRFSDPVADMAFLVMDLTFRGRRDLAHSFAEAYFDASGDIEGQTLLSFYTAYRAVVRGKVEALKAAEMEVAPAERTAARSLAGAYWSLALAELAESA